jgi:3-oxoacyl-[acyl-carrier protein] reductase
MKHAIVTGGTRGIGRAVVEALLHEGYFVHVTYASDVAAAQALQAEVSDAARLELTRVDQASSEAVHAYTRGLVEAGVTVDCIICNAGATLRRATPDITDEEWERVMQVGLNAHFYLIRDLWRQINPDARIVFIGSMMAVQPHATSLPYGVMKAAVHALAKNLVKDFAGTGTTVNVIAPGFVETEWQKNKPQEIRDNICRKTAAGRFAAPEEVADAVLFCLHNAFVNGAVLEVSGGYGYK